MNVGQVSKAIVAFITAGSGALIAGLADGNLSTVEIIIAASTAITAAASVWAVTNAPASNSNPDGTA